MNKKILLSLALTLFLLMNTCIPAFAEQPTAPEISAQAGILMDLKSGRVLYSKNPDEKMYPASTTKILTGILALEKGNLSDTVTATTEAIAPITLEDSHMGILVGEQLTLEQLINGMLIYSANDAANVIAVHIAGSLEGFVSMMNEKAQELGAANSHFANPHGFHNSDHYTTAADLAAITKYAMQNEKFREIVSTARYTIPPTNKYKTERILTSTNHLISRYRNPAYFYAPAIGIKTGYTSQAGNCLVSAAKKGDTEFVSVLLKCSNTKDSCTFTDTKALFEYGFKNYSYQTITAPGDVLSNTKVFGAKNKVGLALTPETEVAALLPVGIDLQSEVTPSVTLNSSIKAPIAKGQALGSVSYTYQGETLGTCTLVAANDVARDNILFVLSILKLIVTSPFFWIGVVILAAIIIFFTVRKRKRRNSRRSRLTSYRR